MSRRPSGLTLVEIMIAMAVIGIALLGAISMAAFSMKQDHHAKERMIAMDAAKTMIEQIEAVPFGSVPGYDGQAFPVDGLDPVDGAVGGDEGEVHVTEVNSRLYRVEVVVRWHGIEGDKKISFFTQLTNR